MKKIGLLLGITIWVITSVRYITGSFLKDADILSAFKSIDGVQVSGKIVAYGTNCTLMSEEDCEIYLRKIISQLGVNCADLGKTEDGLIFIEKKSKNADVKVEISCADGKNYIGIVMDLKENVKCLNTYEELVKEIFEADGIEGDVSLYLYGHLDGALNFAERNYAADKIIRELGAKVVSENRDSNIFTIYAYSDKIPGFVESLGRKVNINVSAEYDEEKNETILYLATPMNNLDY